MRVSMNTRGWVYSGNTKKNTTRTGEPQSADSAQHLLVVVKSAYPWYPPHRLRPWDFDQECQGPVSLPRIPRAGPPSSSCLQVGQMPPYSPVLQAAHPPLPPGQWRLRPLAAPPRTFPKLPLFRQCVLLFPHRASAGLSEARDKLSRGHPCRQPQLPAPSLPRSFPVQRVPPLRAQKPGAFPRLRQFRQQRVLQRPATGHPQAPLPAGKFRPGLRLSWLKVSRAARTYQGHVLPGR
mmetsp:Transcript_46594/g.113282  ORF Transcript_46594/g.113282 Transcript_46594/m.113282 type:complete len:236 (+) Transcript_46594:1137-1844(+)